MFKPSYGAILPDDVKFKNGIYFAHRGDPEAPFKVYLLAGTHGQEIAGPIAAGNLLKDEWKWKHVQALVIFQDPTGYAEEGYGFVGADGHRSCWPPLWGYRQNEEMYWMHIDENSTWGNNVVVPDNHKMMRELMHKFEPDLVLSLHETVRSEIWRDIFWVGAGMLVIETWPISHGELASITDRLGDPTIDPVGWSIRLIWEWLRPSGNVPVWRMGMGGLANNAFYGITTGIAKRYQEYGGSLADRRWMKYMSMIGDLVIGKGRILHGPIYDAADWKTATDYAVGNFGCIGLTTETFQSGELGLRGVDDRVFQQSLYILSVLDEVNESYQIFQGRRNGMDRPVQTLEGDKK